MQLRKKPCASRLRQTSAWQAVIFHDLITFSICDRSRDLIQALSLRVVLITTLSHSNKTEDALIVVILLLENLENLCSEKLKKLRFKIFLRSIRIYCQELAFCTTARLKELLRQNSNWAILMKQILPSSLPPLKHCIFPVWKLSLLENLFFEKDGAFSRDYLDAKQQITDWLFWAHHNVRQALDCWGYLLNGSEFLAAIANRLNAADKLIGYGKPVIVECLISREQLDFSFWKSIAAREIEEVLNKILFPNAEYKRRVSSGFHISTVIPPERLKFHFPNELVVQTEYFDFNTNQIHRVMERKLCFNQKVAA